ncbi:MAG: ATP-binding domain-containing protein, partial [Myxococcales bacterium]|nr:ATP-binding domain-containing protein [Myxococcales bacterium]
EWWHGRAIMVLRNDYSLQLFNGDVGITLGEGSSAVVVFHSEQGGFRTLAPAMLPEHETAFALTVHKSQGSEFTRILLVLPPGVTELLTRELVYTALTRAKTGAAIYGSPESFDAACARRVARASGVRELLER